jgi:hypothetical protein
VPTARMSPFELVSLDIISKGAVTTRMVNIAVLRVIRLNWSACH